MISQMSRLHRHGDYCPRSGLWGNIPSGSVRKYLPLAGKDTQRGDEHQERGVVPGEELVLREEVYLVPRMVLKEDVVTQRGK